jgi:hypothetical protein
MTGQRDAILLLWPFGVLGFRKNRRKSMPTCADMKVGQIYTCKSCGVELQVVKECTECGDNCAEDPCGFACCNEDMVLKS